MSADTPEKDGKEAAAETSGNRPAPEGEEPNISNEQTFLKLGDDEPAGQDEETALKKPAGEQAALESGETKILDKESVPDVDAGATVRTDVRPEPAAEPEAKKEKEAKKDKEAKKEEKGKEKEKGKAEGEAAEARPAEKPSRKVEKLASSTRVLDSKPANPAVLGYLAAALALALVGLAVVAGWRKSRVPDEFELQMAYLQSFRIPEEANPPAEQVRFEFERERKCAGHEEDRCLVYRITGPKLNSLMTVYKSSSGWTRHRGDTVH